MLVLSVNLVRKLYIIALLNERLDLLFRGLSSEPLIHRGRVVHGHLKHQT